MESTKTVPLQKGFKGLLQRIFSPISKLSKKNKIITLVIITVFALSIRFIVSQVTLSQKVEFYPPENNSSTRLQRVYRLFWSKEYSTLTSYIDQQLLDGVQNNERVELLFYQAESYFQLQQYEVAKKNFEILKTQSPHFWQSYLRLAAIELLLKDLRPFMSLIKNLPPSNELYYWQGRYYEALGANTEALESYYKSNLDDVRVSFQLGKLFYNKKKYDTAIVFLEKTINNNESNSKNLEVFILLFYSYATLADHQNTIKYTNAIKPYLNNHVELIPDISHVLYNMGEISQARSVYTVFDTETALTSDIASILIKLSYELNDYLSVIRYSKYINIDDTTTLYIIQANYKMQKYYKAAQMIAQYLERKEKFLSIEEKVKLLTMQADSYEKQNQISNAIKSREMLDKLISSNENRFMLIELYKKQHQVKKIFYLIDKIYQENPLEVPHLVSILISLKEYKQAQNLLTKALLKFPNNEEYLLTQSKLYSQQKYLEKLKITLHKLLQLNIKDSSIEYQANYALGSLYIHNQNYFDAQIFLEKAKSLKNTKEVNIKLLLVYYLQNDYEQARIILQSIQSDIKFMNNLTETEKQVIYPIANKLASN